MKSIEDILALCIEDIKTGRATLEGCLAEYPAMRQQLEPLLRVALSIQEPPAFKPTNDFRIRTRVQLMDHIHNEQNRKKSWATIFNSGIRHSWHAGWSRAVTIIVAALIVFSASGAGTAYAAKDSLPGETLYSVKSATEQVRRLLTFNDISRIELELELAGVRLEEMQSLTEKSPERITLAIEGYENNIALAIDKAENYRDISAEGLEMVALEALKHIAKIDGIIDGAATTEREAVRQAEEVTFSLQFRALRTMAEEDAVRATEINIETVQNRLNRANAAANTGDISEAEAALKQYEEIRRFGEEISRIAKAYGHDTTAIDTLNEQAASAQLEIINKMHGKLPDETISSLKKAFGQPEDDPGKETESQTQEKPDNNTPEEPGNQPEEPGKQPEEPGSQPEEPGSQPEQPGTPPEEPGSPPEQPGTPPEEPGSPPEEPGSPPEEPGSPPGDPGNGNGGSGNGKK